ncbi:MAG: hypothetical protein PQJ46_01795 [Spirochaetales bacterium]|nr:hypothetical protein [Spirochaetales bacterium]
MNKNLYQINLLGTSFSIQTDEETEKMDQIVSILREKTEMVESDLFVKDPLKNIILSSIIVIDEFLKEQQKHTVEGGLASEEVERLTLQIIERIDRSLE